VDSQVKKNPAVIEARELLNSSAFKAKSLNQPIYNPNLETSYEREGDGNNYSIGFSQTIDLNDKKSINENIGKLSYIADQNRLKAIFEQTKADALTALIKWQFAQKNAVLAFEQERQLQRLLTIVDEKKSAGILEPLDVELIYLNLSKTLISISENQIKLKETEVKIKELLPDWTPEKVVIPVNGLGLSNYRIDPNWIVQHPVVELAKTEWKVKQISTRLIEKTSKADPTIGLSAGKNDRENIVGITFSMPLNIRNNYSDEIKASYSETLAAEAKFQSVYRQQTFVAKANYESLSTSKKYFEQWRTLTAGRADNSAKLLNVSWESGDISTSDYLTGLSQRADGLYSGIELEMQFKLREISFLLSIGQISHLKI
jgi:cobalt-zinc-cadmium efflux system outer membrane protein